MSAWFNFTELPILKICRIISVTHVRNSLNIILLQAYFEQNDVFAVMVITRSLNLYSDLVLGNQNISKKNSVCGILKFHFLVNHICFRRDSVWRSKFLKKKQKSLV